MEAVGVMPKRATSRGSVRTACWVAWSDSQKIVARSPSLTLRVGPPSDSTSALDQSDGKNWLTKSALNAMSSFDSLTDDG
jgi:hypothetical protein